LGMVLRANEAKLGRLREGRVESDEELRARAAKGTDTRWLHEHDVVKAWEEAVRRREGGVVRL
jgi:salicylate hydroxylase